MNIYFSSDYHLGHTNILKYDNRPFKDIDHHDNVIIERHNSIVNPRDMFYFLGDFCFNQSKAEEYLKRLNGQKVFISGNHDKKNILDLYRKYGVYLGGLARVTIEKQDITLCHYAMRVWSRSHKGSWCLYGHSHGNLEGTVWGKSMDVGINTHEYYPYSFDEIKKILDKREYTLHHPGVEGVVEEKED